MPRDVTKTFFHKTETKTKTSAGKTETKTKTSLGETKTKTSLGKIETKTCASFLFSVLIQGDSKKNTPLWKPQYLGDALLDHNKNI